VEKYFECPNFGFVFEAPAMDIKFSHTGVTFPGFGLVKCPQCKEEKRRKYYKIVPESDLAKNTADNSEAPPNQHTIPKPRR
jgi:hypothetical protein